VLAKKGSNEILKKELESFTHSSYRRIP